MRVAGTDVEAVRVALRGWVEKRAGMMSVRARYEAAAWVSPQLHRVVRFEVRSRSAGGYGGSAFQIDEVAECAVFLCSSAASYVTGTILDCDGGSQLGDATQRQFAAAKA